MRCNCRSILRLNAVRHMQMNTQVLFSYSFPENNLWSLLLFLCGIILIFEFDRAFLAYSTSVFFSFLFYYSLSGCSAHMKKTAFIFMTVLEWPYRNTRVSFCVCPSEANTICSNMHAACMYFFRFFPSILVEEQKKMKLPFAAVHAANGKKLDSLIVCMIQHAVCNLVVLWHMPRNE